MDRRQLLFGASALGLVTNLNLNHPLIAQVGTAVMGSRRLSDRERAGLRGPVKTCSDLIGREIGINTDYSPDGRLLGYRVPRGGIFPWLGISDIVDVTTEFYDKQSNTTKVGRVSIGVTDEFQYDARGRKTRVRKVSPCTFLLIPGYWAMLETFEFAEAGCSLSGGGTVTTRYNENDQPIESLICNANGELLMKINHNYANGRLISETLVIVRLSETLVIWRRQMQERFPENEQERENMAKTRAILDQLQGLGMECSYTYDADDRVIRTLMQVGDFKGDESKTYNEQGDEDWTLTIGIIDDVRSEFRYLYQYDSHGNWTERTTVNADHTDNPNTQRRTLSYYGFS
jgi:hypothetical protein